MTIKQLYNINKSDADENRPGSPGATELPQGSREERRMNLNEEILKLADEYESYIIDCRRKVHTFAELAMHEDSARICSAWFDSARILRRENCNDTKLSGSHKT